MLRRSYFLFFILVITWPILAGGQGKYYQPDTTVKVYAYGKEQTLAWCKGFNNPQFTMGDLNHDGKEDLVVFEPWNSLRTFINTGVTGADGVPIYRYAPEYEVNFPPLLDYLVLADYNCDGIPDLFHQGSYGFAVYTGYYNAYNQLAFRFFKDLFYNNDLYLSGNYNAFNNPGDIPAIVDVDGDGALDFIAYDISGGTMNLYKNMRIAKGLPCDSLYIDLADRCWGRVYQGVDRAHTIPYVCDETHLRLPRGSGKVTHTGNTPCLFDWDMDGDYDYLDGNVWFNEMTFLKNGRKEYNASGPDTMVVQDTLWQSFAGGKQIEIAKFPAAFNVDIDQDGKKDLLIAPNTALTENYNCVWYYKNFSTPGVPDWRFQSDSFLVDKSIDLGSGAYPALFDFNKDGKPDLFVGSDGYYRASDGGLHARISYYQNTSTAGHPSFTLQTKDLNGIDSFNFKGIAPAFGDINNDGKADMVFGHTDGTLTYFRNMAASNAVAPDWQMTEMVLRDVNGDTITTNGYSAPFIYDIDKDGKPDLLLGGTDGYLTYYQNVSDTAGLLKLRLINKQLGHVRADPNHMSGNYSVPFIGKIDSSNTEYLLLGSSSGNVYKYTGFQGGDTTATYTLMDAHFAYIDSAYSSYNHSITGTAGGFYIVNRSTVAVGDVAGNGTYNMFVGDMKGGLGSYTIRAYVPPPISHVGTTVVNENGSVLVYPNPAKESLTVSWSGILQPDVQISIVNMEGQSLYTTSSSSTASRATLPVDMLPSGMYVCLVQSGFKRYYSKFTVVR